MCNHSTVTGTLRDGYNLESAPRGNCWVQMWSPLSLFILDSTHSDSPYDPIGVLASALV